MNRNVLTCTDVVNYGVRGIAMATAFWAADAFLVVLKDGLISFDRHRHWLMVGARRILVASDATCRDRQLRAWIRHVGREPHVPVTGRDGLATDKLLRS